MNKVSINELLSIWKMLSISIRDSHVAWKFHKIVYVMKNGHSANLKIKSY